MKQAMYEAWIAAEKPGGGYGTGGLRSWIEDNVVSLVLLIIALCALWAGKAGNISKTVTIGACMILGVIFLGLAVTPGGATGVGKWIVGLFTGG